MERNTDVGSPSLLKSSGLSALEVLKTSAADKCLQIQRRIKETTALGQDTMSLDDEAFNTEAALDRCILRLIASCCNGDKLERATELVKFLLLEKSVRDMDAKVKSMIKLIEEDADSFARRAEMYYKKRPKLMKLVEEFYRAYRALAERYDYAIGELRHAQQTLHADQNNCII